MFCHSMKHSIMSKKWRSLGLEYTDETIFENRPESKEIYGVEGILTETLSNTMDEINQIFGELGIKETSLA